MRFDDYKESLQSIYWKLMNVPKINSIIIGNTDNSKVHEFHKVNDYNSERNKNNHSRKHSTMC